MFDCNYNISIFLLSLFTGSIKRNHLIRQGLGSVDFEISKKKKSFGCVFSSPFT